MKRTKLFLKIYLGLTMVVGVAFLGLKAPEFYYMFKTKEAIAVGGFPMQFGITGAVLTPCVCIPPFCNGCTGGALCTVGAVPPCTIYTDVKGAPSGGSGANILLMTSTLAKIGLTAGGQVIAGGIAPTMIMISASMTGFSVGP